MRPKLRQTLVGAVVAAALIACSPTPEPAPQPASQPAAERAAGVDREAEHAVERAMERAASDIVGFLQGTVAFDQLRLADSVTLHVTPEGGGASATFPRGALRERSAWEVPVGSRRVSLVPGAGLTRLTTRVGRHFACQEQTLAAKHPRLAATPHVGARLEPSAGQSCLQTWNLTFLFDRRAPDARVVGAVYDQWEW